MIEPEFKYDVAFSFLADDEGLATKLADQLRERMNVFVYSERQKDLAGKDGMEAFSRVFRDESRIVVVLFRRGWGTTKWTRVEETAIRDRVFESGWDSLVVIALDAEGAPRWLPRTKLWFGFERFGLAGAAAVIDARFRDTGGEARDESARDRAERLARQARAAKDRRDRENSTEAIVAAEDQLNQIRVALDELASQITGIDQGMPAVFDEDDHRSWRIRIGRFAASFQWHIRYSNSLEGSGLYVNLWDARRQRISRDSGEQPLLMREYHLTLSEDDMWVWRDANTETRPLTSALLADEIVKLLLDRAYEAGETTVQWRV